jgi:hypothetical protein
MPDENIPPIQESGETLLKKRGVARAAMGGAVQKETPSVTDGKKIREVSVQKQIPTALLKKEVSRPISSTKKIFTPPAFEIPPLKETVKKIEPETKIKKEKKLEPPLIVPTNHQEAGLPKGEVLSLEIVAKKKRFIIGGILFTLIGGLLIILAVVFLKKEPTIPNRPAPLAIVPDTTTVVSEGTSTNETRRLIWEAINAVTSPVNALHVLSLYKDEKGDPLSGTAFFSALDLNVPASMTSDLTNVLFGFIHNEGRDSFLILKIKNGNNYYESAVQGMNLWERDMAETLGAFMSQKEILENGTWSDDTVANIPVRNKESKEGTQIMYGFFDKETIVIAKTKEVFGIVSRRLRTPLPLGGN